MPTFAHSVIRVFLDHAEHNLGETRIKLGSASVYDFLADPFL
jgi:hypothetical protein